MSEMKFCPQCGHPLTPQMRDAKERLACVNSSCEYVFWDNPTPVVAAIITQGQQVILARGRGWLPDRFALIAGFLERGERPDDAVLREVREELGVSGRIAEFVGYYSFTLRNQIIFVFQVEIFDEPVLGDEIEEIKRLAPQEVVPWSRGTGPAVRDWLTRHGY
jgi:NADH pyrophosphatase NudC (nudix superfamily)